MAALPPARAAQVDRAVDELHERMRSAAGGALTLPVDLEAIARDRGLRIEVVDGGLVGSVLANRSGVPVSGAIDFAAGRIYVNGRERNEGRRRFTIAHELAHELLDHERALGDGLHVESGALASVLGIDADTHAPPTDARVLLEHEADHAAGRMLVPPAELDAAVAEIGVASVPLLAARFGTSTHAMQVRVCDYLPHLVDVELGVAEADA